MGDSYRVVFDDGTDKIVHIERTDTVVLDDEYVHKLRSDWDSSPRIDEPEKLERPRNWLLRVLYNLFVDTTRHWDRTNVTSLSSIEAHDSSLILESIEPGPEECADALILEAVMEQGHERAYRESTAWEPSFSLRL